MGNPRLVEALAYVARGWLVVPLHYPIRTVGRSVLCSCRRTQCASIGKHPMTRYGVKDSSGQADQLERWWSEWPEANVGVATGAQSNLVVLDIDPRHGGDDSLLELEKEFGKLPATPTSLTGGGGQHFLFLHPGGGRRVASATAVRPGVDIRADGTLIVAPPSRHASGSDYHWDGGFHPEDCPLAIPPSWVVAPSTPGARGVAARRTVSFWRQKTSEPIVEGSRNEAIAQLSGHLLRRGVDPFVALDLLRALNQTRCRPPLSDDEIQRTVNSIAGNELRRRGMRT
ncbi:MAG: bifunctional DNA primase/polymerase [Deltaproteobacteria bacterium]